MGVQWCVDTDTFRFKVEVRNQPPTRRGILSTVSSVYDPLGFLCPFVLKAKQMLQELCRIQLGWDEKVPESYFSKWNNWVRDLPNLSEFRVPRCFKPDDFGEITSAELHHFSDAS